MSKIYKFQLSLNLSLLVNHLATINSQVSINNSPNFSLKNVDKKPLSNRKNISIIDVNIDTRWSNKVAWRSNKRLKMTKIETPPEKEVSFEYMESEKRSIGRKRKIMHPGSRGKEVPSLSWIMDTLEANSSLYKIWGEDIISPIKDVGKGGGKKGCHRYGQDQSKT